MHILVNRRGRHDRAQARRKTGQPRETARAGNCPSAALTDVVAPETPRDFTGAVEASTIDLSAPGAATKAVASRPDVIFHLAGVVSGEAEVDFEKGYRVNLDGTRALFEAVRSADFKPKIVFTSSIAVYGAPFPSSISDDFHLTPLTSYGTQKAICELLLADYTRRGFFDGVGIRLPTICVRPGKPNKAASGFFSSIIREPFAGQEALLPVAESIRHTHASPRAAVGFLIHAAGLTTEQLGPKSILQCQAYLARLANKSTHFVASRETKWPHAYGANQISLFSGLSPAGRNASMASARATLVFRRNPHSTTLFASISRMSLAGRSPIDADNAYA